jgi:hypothetical protein
MLSHISGDLVRLIKLLGKALDPQRLSQHDYERLNELVSSLIAQCDSEPELKIRSIFALMIFIKRWLITSFSFVALSPIKSKKWTLFGLPQQNILSTRSSSLASRFYIYQA